MQERNWKNRLFSISMLLVGGWLLFQLRDNIRYSFIRSPEAFLPAQTRLRSYAGLFTSTWVELPRTLPLQYHKGTWLNRGSEAALEAWPILPNSTPEIQDAFLVLVHPRQQTSSAWMQPWRGRLRSLAQDPLQNSILKYAQEHHWFDRTVDLQALQQNPTLAQAKAWPTHERKDQPVTDQQMISLEVLFPNEIRVLLPKTQYATLQAANQAIQNLPFPHAPGVETTTGYGYVLQLPKDTETLQHAWMQIRQTGWAYETQRMERYVFRREQASWNTAGWTLPGASQLPQPTQYEAQPGTKSLVPSSSEKTFLPWSSIQSISLCQAPLHAKEIWILHAEENPATVRQWVWPLLAGIIALLIFHCISLFQSFRRIPLQPHQPLK